MIEIKEKLNDAVKDLGDGEFKNELIALSEHLEKMHKELVATSPHRISGQIRLAEKIGDIYAGIINYSGFKRMSSAKRRLYSRLYLDADETEFCAAKSCTCQTYQSS